MSQPVEKNSPAKKNHTHEKRNPFVYGMAAAILVLVGVGFVFFGPTLGSGVASSNSTFGSYAGIEIKDIQGSYFMNTASSLAQQQGGETNAFSAMSVLYQAFNETVMHYAMLDKAKTLGFTVSNLEVLKNLAQYEAFQNAKKELDLEALQRRADYNEIIADTRESLIRSAMVGEYTDAAPSSEAERAFIASTYAARRVLSVVQFTSDDYPDAEVLAYARANEDKFKQYKLATITVATKNQAEEVLNQLKANTATFEDLAKANSVDQWKDAGGTWTPTYRYALQNAYSDEAILESIEKLPVGEVSAPLPGTNGQFVIFKNLEAAMAPLYEDPTFVGTVRSYLLSQERGLVEDWLEARAQTFAQEAASIGLEAFASTQGKVVAQTRAFPINTPSPGTNAFSINTLYGAYSLLPTVQLADGGDLSSFTSLEGFFQDVFALKQGEISKPMVAGGKVALFSLVEETQADETETGILTQYLDTIIKQLKNEDIRTVAINKNKLVDRFSQGFQEWSTRAGLNN